jgi:predicted nucleic acid-binding protein
VGLPAHEIEDRIKEMNKKLDNGRLDVDDALSK